MSNELRQKLDAIIAGIGFNDGANKGFWRIQPRDDEGQWIEMGADVLFRFRTGKGNLVVATERGVYVGPAGRPGYARVMIAKDTASGLKAGVYELESRNLQQFKAIIPNANGKKSGQRLDKFGKPVETLEDSKLPDLQNLLADAKPITKEDQRLAKGDLTPAERSAEADGRKNSPIADMPAGFESDNPDEAAKLLKDSGIDPAEFDKASTANNDPIAEIMADVAYNGDTDVKLDDLLKGDSLALAREATKKKVPFDIDPGDIILGEDGSEKTVLDIRFGNSSTNTPARIKVQNSDGSVEELTPAMNDRLDVVTGRRGRPIRPAAPEKPSTTPDTAAPESKDAPDAEDSADSTIGETDSVDLVPNAVPGLQPTNFPPQDRMDDGSEFSLPTLSTEQIDAARNMTLDPLLDADGTPAKYVNENNQVVDAEDPFAMMAALAKIYPNAKFTEDGALILHRQRDKDGRIFELRANNSGKKAIIYSMRWTDPNTGEYKEYQHKDDRHSIKALLRKDNGPQDLLDRLLGRVDNNGKDWGLPENYKFGNTKWSRGDSLFKRLKWFMSGTGDRKKMEEVGDNAVRLAEGRQAVYHKDGTIKNSEIPSLWDAFKEYYSSGSSSSERDIAAREDLYHVLYGVFGRIALDEKSHARARRAIRDEFAKQFPNRSTKETRAFNGIITAASERMRGIYREPDANVRSIRYASKDRTRAVENGMTVEYTNNVGETSIVKVSNLIQNVTATPDNVNGTYDYGDYVVIKDANGNQIKVNALKLRILDDQNSELTAYRPNLRGEALRQRRIDLGLWTPENPQGIRERTPYLGAGVGTVVSDPPAPPRLIDDFVPGEMLYNKEGKPLGIIRAVRPVTGKNGSKGLAFLYTKADGTEGQASYSLGTEITPKKA